MSRSLPPAAATWLLAHVGCGPTVEPLAGDLVEEYRAGRSAGWYWRQVVAAVATGLAEELRRHKFLVIRAMLTGLAGMFLFGWLLGDPLFDWIDGLAEVRGMAPRIYPPMIIGSVGYVISAWIVARLHRAHRSATVVSFLACALVFQLPRLCSLVVDAVGHPRYLPYLSGHLAGMTLTIVSVLVGGFWPDASAPRSTRPASSRS